MLDAPGDDADARFDSALRCAQLTERTSRICWPITCTSLTMGPDEDREESWRVIYRAAVRPCSAARGAVRRRLGAAITCAPDGASAFWARRRLRGTRLHATYTDWSAGAGAELRGPIRMLLLLWTGRTTTALPVRGACRQSSSAPGYCVPRLTKADHPVSTTIHEGR